MKNIKNYAQFFEEYEEFESEKYYKNISKSTAAKKKAQMAKQAKMDDNNPAAYKELPGDTKGKNFIKTSTHTKKYHEKFGND